MTESAAPTVVEDREFSVAARSQRRTIARRFLRHRPAIVSLVVLTAITLFVFIFPIFWEWPFTKRDKTALSQPPSWDHPFGTDELGKDVLGRVMRGTQRSLEIALIAAFLVTIIGVTLGAIAGYFRGWIDAVIMRFTDLILTLPLLIVVAVVSVGYPGSPWYTIPVILGLFAWTTLARIVRAEFMSLREKEFVEAARAVGARDRRIIFKHILPNLAGPIIVAATLSIAGTIITETALSFLGLGVRAPDVSLGLLIQESLTAFKTRPWLFWFPAVAIVTVCLSVNFIGDGLRDAFDPKQNRIKA
ncbi:MAG: ABC transporter permease [Actinomycetota bacterium]|nr:ABC transporter permease [Actinomycetota bacterium]